MKKIILTLTILIFTIPGYSQVIIGDEQGVSGSNTDSVLLDFKEENRGMILPYVTTKNTTPTEGSILLDVSTSNEAKVMFYNGLGIHNGWVNLSNDNDTDNTPDVTTILSSQPTNYSENPNEPGVVLGELSNSTPKDGVLVLESTTKAMVLPQVNSVMDIVAPSPGMMVFVTSQDLLAVFNGKHWAFWKATK